MKLCADETATKRCTKCGERFISEYPKLNLPHKKCGGELFVIETFKPNCRTREKSGLSPRELRNHWARESIKGLSDSYIKQVLGDRNLPREIIEMKREQLLIHRATKQLLQTIKEKTK
jgi:hypothetical protein